MIIRHMKSVEAEILFDVFMSSIYGIASKDYNKQQIDVWVSKDRDIKQWNELMRQSKPFVVCFDKLLILGGFPIFWRFFLLFNCNAIIFLNKDNMQI